MGSWGLLEMSSADTLSIWASCIHCQISTSYRYELLGVADQLYISCTTGGGRRLLSQLIQELQGDAAKTCLLRSLVWACAGPHAAALTG